MRLKAVVRWLRLNTFAMLTFSIGTALGIAGLYPIFFEPRASLTYQILSDSNILDVQRSIQDLTIRFQGEDIQSKNLNLRLVRIHVQNTGQVNILTTHYDPADIWGLTIRDSRIIEARLIDTDSEYIRQSLRPVILDESTVSLAKIVFDKSQYFTLELLILNPKDIIPEIIPIGKVSGIESSELVRSILDKNTNLFTEISQGTVMAHITRAVITIFSFIVMIFLVAFIFGTLDQRNRSINEIRKKKREQDREDELNSNFMHNSEQLNNLKAIKGYDRSKRRGFLYEYGSSSRVLGIFYQAKNVLDNPEEMKGILSIYNSRKSAGNISKSFSDHFEPIRIMDEIYISELRHIERFNSLEVIDSNNISRRYHTNAFEINELMTKMIECGDITLDDTNGSVHVNVELIEDIDDIISVIQTMGKGYSGPWALSTYSE